MRNGDTQMRHIPQMRHKRNEVRNFIMSSLRKGDTYEVILFELCHKLGLKIGNAKLHLKKAKAQHAEETRTKVVKSLMTGKDVTILASTPLACDPSKETYWSM